MSAVNHSHFDRLWLAAGEKTAEREYWLNQLAGLSVKGGFPSVIDAVGREEQSPGPAGLDFIFGQEPSRGLIALSNQSDIRLHILLTAILTVLLGKYSGLEDILIGAPVLKPGTGLDLINRVLVLRFRYDGLQTFKELLRQARETMIEADKHRNYPIEVLSSQLGVPIKGAGDCPLFEVAVLLENIHDSEFLGQMRPKMTFLFTRLEREIQGRVAYLGTSYRRQEVEQIVAHYLQVAKIILENPGIRLTEIDVLLPEERGRLVSDFNRTEAAYPQEKGIFELFAGQVEKTPDRLALVGPSLCTLQRAGQRASENVLLSFIEVYRRANDLAGRLLERGVKPNTVVGIMADRSVEMIIGILAILAAGGAYLPIDPEAPQERVQYMLHDSGAEIVFGPQACGEEQIPAGAVLSHQSPSLPAKTVLSFACGFTNCGLSAIRFSMALASAKLRQRLQGRTRLKGAFIGSPGIAAAHRSTDSPRPSVGEGSGVRGGNPAPTDLAYVIYTSGSTGRPKGVLIQHHSVVNLISHQQKAFRIDRRDRILQFSSLCFDASVEQVFLALLSGAVLVLVDKETRLNGGAFIAYITAQCITHLHTVPYFLNSLELGNTGSLKRILSGGDVCPVRLAEKMMKYGAFYNRYGPTETTVTSIEMRVTGNLADKVPIGRPLGNTLIYIIDKWQNLQPVGVAGELSIGGDGLARGYLNNPELTAEKFLDVGANNYSPLRDNDVIRLYKTGDLCRWLPDGNIDFLGRIDSQVKIRGFRIELGEIEAQLLKHPAIKEAVVIAREDRAGEKFLLACLKRRATEEKSGDLTAELLNFLSVKLPSYMLPDRLVLLEEIPLNPNGKIDRKALSQLELKSDRPYIAPRDEIEGRLVDLWSELLGIDNPKPGIDDNFFSLGGQSLKAATLAYRVYQKFQVDLDIADIFSFPTIRQQAERLKTRGKGVYREIPALEKREYYALSNAQQRLWVLHQFAPGATAYNIYSLLELSGDLDSERLTGCFKQLVARHESLRTSFEMVGEEPVQRVHEQVAFELEVFSADGRGGCSGQELIEPIIQGFVRPFDLARPPLLRVGSIQVEKLRHILLVDMHHIIADGLSVGILIKEFGDLWLGKDLPGLRVQYKDYAAWQRLERGKALIDQQAYWLKEFSGDIPVLNLPGDFQRPAIQSFSGRSPSFVLENETSRALDRLAQEQNVTLFMVLLALFNVFLSRLTGQEDIVVGTPVAGRLHPDLEPIVGMFVNTLALRNYPGQERNFTDFLQEVKQRTLAAFSHQEYLFEELVPQLALNRDVSRNPLFDVMIVLQNQGKTELDIPGLKIKPHDFQDQAAKFDITLTVSEMEEGRLFTWQYCTKLFKDETVRRYMDYFKEVLRSVLQSPGRKLLEIEILPQAEKKRLLDDFNRTAREFPHEKTIPELFMAQAEKTPDRVAIKGPGLLADHKGPARSEDEIHLAYKELNRQSDRLADSLMARGVQRETIVALWAERNVETVIGLLGILKASAAYLPIDPDYPPERIEYMLQDSGAEITLNSALSPVRGGAYAAIPFTTGQNCAQFCLRLHELRAFRNSVQHARSGDCCCAPRATTDLAYVIYTSGSTGRPKGVMIQHRSVINLIYSQQAEFGIDHREMILQFASLCFDASVEQVFLALLGGGVLVLAHKEILLSGSAFRRYIARQCITHLHTVPSFLGAVELGKVKSLKRVLAGGDVCTPALVDKFKGKTDFYNEYGPTETTVTSIEMRVRPGDMFDGRLPIGRPVGNTAVYIVDRWLRLLPMGVTGEMAIGGQGVARGYLNNPELTAEKFVGADIPIGAELTHRLYKTGDLARWLDDGHIEFLGRLDQQVKIRGFRIELQEIEARLLKHPAIEEAVVIAREDKSGEKYLAAFLQAREPGLKPGKTELSDFLARSLPAYMIPAYFLFLPGFFMNANGKIDRKRLPDPTETGSIDPGYAPPQNEMETAVANIWAEVLHVDRPGIHDNFFASGGHSLKAIRLIAALKKRLQVHLDIGDLFRFPTIAGICRRMAGQKTPGNAEIDSGPQQEFYELSYSQTRLWLLYKLAPGSPAFNMVGRCTLFEAVDERLVKEILETIVARHEGLRTYFTEIDEQPVQIIRPKVELNLQSIDLSLSTDVERETRRRGLLAAAQRRGFNLERAPLFRVCLVKCRQQEYDLLFSLHHIICDGWSLEILREEFLSLHQAAKQGRACELAPLPIQYRDYAAWHNRLLADEARVEKARLFWKNQLSGGVPVLHLPYDFYRHHLVDKRSGEYRLVVGEEITQRLRAKGVDYQATLFMILLAGLFLLLYQLTGQDDIVIGTPGAGRQDDDLKNVIGFFVNTLVIRTRIDPDERFNDLLSGLQEKTLHVLEHQHYPLERVCSELKIDYPEISVFFNLINISDHLEDLDNRESRHGGDVQEAKFDLVWYLKEYRNAVDINIHYYQGLFTPVTIEKIGGLYIGLLDQVSQKPDLQVKEYGGKKKRIAFNQGGGG